MAPDPFGDEAPASPAVSPTPEGSGTDAPEAQTPPADAPDPSGPAASPDGTAVTEPPAAEAEPADDKPAILVAEDNDDTRMLLDRILRSTYAVTAVGDARSAQIGRIGVELRLMRRIGGHP